MLGRADTTRSHSTERVHLRIADLDLQTVTYLQAEDAVSAGALMAESMAWAEEWDAALPMAPTWVLASVAVWLSAMALRWR